MNCSALVVAYLAMSLVAVVQPSSAQEVDRRTGILPEPTGPYSVASHRLWVVDSSRGEPATPDPTDYRELHIQVFYPVVSQSQANPRATYFRNLEAFEGVYDAATLARLRAVRSHSQVGGPVAAPAAARSESTFPIVLFVHGWRSQSDAYTTLMEEIASQGVFAVAIDQPYQGYVALRPGGVSEPREDQFADPMEMVGFYGADQSLVLSRLETLNESHPELRGHMDLSRVVVTGHSNGALSALSAAASDDRVGGAVAIDSWDGIFEQVFGIDVPLLLIRTGGAPPFSDSYFADHGRVIEASLVNAEHSSSSDWPILRATSGSERTRAIDNVRTVAGLIVDMLRSLNGAFRLSASSANLVLRSR